MKKSWIVILSVVAALVVAILLLVVCGVFDSDTTCKSETACKHEEEKTEIAEPDHAAAVKVFDGKADLMSVPKKVTVIDFNATWCGPCRQFAPVLESVAQKYAHTADFYSVDVDNYPDLAASFGVTSIPKVVVLFPDGSRNEEVGYMDASQLEHLMQKK